MTWFHLITATGQHIVFPLSAIVYMTANAVDGSQQIFMFLIDGSQYQLTQAQALKIIGTLPAPL